MSGNPEPALASYDNEIPPPPADLIGEFLAAVEAEAVANAASAAPAVVIPDSSVPSPMLLRQVWALVERMITASGGGPGEADDVAREMAAYVDFAWRSLGLNVLASDPEAWQAHLAREAHRRWLALLLRRGGGAAGDEASSAEVGVLDLATTARLVPDDRGLLEYLYLHRFSVEETAIALGRHPAEISARLDRIRATLHTTMTLAPVAEEGRGASADLAQSSTVVVPHTPAEAATVASTAKRRPLGRQPHGMSCAPTSAQVAEVWELMVRSLVTRGFPRADAEDVAQESFERMMREPSLWLDKLGDLDQHKGWFITVALNSYLMMLRGQGRRRRREHHHWEAMAGVGEEVLHRGPTGADILVLAEQAKLTNRQRAYLEAVLLDHMGIDEIAEVTNTTARAVRAVLVRAVDRLRRQVECQEA